MYVHNGLLPNTAHTYRYRAKDAGGAGDWSELITVNTLARGTTTANNIKADDIFNLVITGADLSNSTQTVSITYNPSDVELLDLCSFTSTPETITSGTISGTNITINQNTAGTINFTADLSITEGKSWSGVLNMIKFKAIVDNPNISY